MMSLMMWSKDAERATRMAETQAERRARWEMARAEAIAPYEGREDALSMMACLDAMSHQYSKEELETRCFGDTVPPA
jgi:hypothetical protein